MAPGLRGRWPGSCPSPSSKAERVRETANLGVVRRASSLRRTWCTPPSAVLARLDLGRFTHPFQAGLNTLPEISYILGDDDYLGVVRRASSLRRSWCTPPSVLARLDLGRFTHPFQAGLNTLPEISLILGDDDYLGVPRASRCGGTWCTPHAAELARLDLGRFTAPLPAHDLYALLPHLGWQLIWRFREVFPIVPRLASAMRPDRSTRTV